MDYLPEEVLLEILKFLNVNQLLNMNIVCKQWYKALNEENFWLQKSKEKFFTLNNILMFYDVDLNKKRRNKSIIIKRILNLIKINEIEEPPNESLKLFNNTITWNYSFDFREKLLSVEPINFQYELFYCEITLLTFSKKSRFAFGLSNGEYIRTNHEFIGLLPDSIGYHKQGGIIDGSNFFFFEPYSKDDIVGVGVYFPNNLIFFTKNDMVFFYKEKVFNFDEIYVEYDIEKDINFKVNYGMEDFNFDLRTLNLKRNGK